MDEFKNVVVMGAGSVEYSRETAEIDIQQLIDALVEQREDGATHVVMSSGNYRGARWQSISTYFEWLDDEED